MLKTAANVQKLITISWYTAVFVEKVLELRISKVVMRKMARLYLLKQFSQFF